MWNIILVLIWKRFVIKLIDMMYWLYSIYCFFLNVKWSWCFCFKYDFKNLFFSYIFELKFRNCEKNFFLKVAFLFFIALGEGGWRFIFFMVIVNLLLNFCIVDLCLVLIFVLFIDKLSFILNFINFKGVKVIFKMIFFF